MLGEHARRRCSLTLALLLVPITYVAVNAEREAEAATGCLPAPYGVSRYAPGTGRTVALTFDDGPGRDTARIIAVLRAKRVTATFFNLGATEAANPAAVRAQQAGGYVLGGHTWDHAYLPGRGTSGQAAEMDSERSRQYAITGAYPCVFRPPYGSFDSATLTLAYQRRMRVWNWSVDPQDWMAGGSSGAYWVQRITAVAQAGSWLEHPVILLHDMPGGSPATVAALPAIIDHYRARGYRFVDLLGNTGPPTLTSVSPSAGRTAGGVRVNITGTGLRGVRAVLFGTVPATSIRFVSPARLIVTAPRHAAGRVDVRVVTNHGTTPVQTRDRYTYVAPPAVTGISPTSGPTGGATLVQVYGTNFTRVTKVQFGSLPAASARVASSTLLYVTSPPAAAGTVGIRVTTAFGASVERPADRFTYVEPPPPPEPPPSTEPPPTVAAPSSPSTGSS